MQRAMLRSYFVMAARSDSWTLKHCRFAIRFPHAVDVDSLRPGEVLVYISQDDDMYVVSGDWFDTLTEPKASQTANIANMMARWLPPRMLACLVPGRRSNVFSAAGVEEEPGSRSRLWTNVAVGLQLSVLCLKTGMNSHDAHAAGARGKRCSECLSARHYNTTRDSKDQRALY